MYRSAKALLRALHVEIGDSQRPWLWGWLRALRMTGVEMRACAYCGGEHTETDYRRGRGGRPYDRTRVYLKTYGLHICWICGRAIDMGLPATDRWSWSMDHVIPLADAPCLALDHSNLREAHRSCNSSKGRRTTPVHTHTTNSRDW